jgi:hypothetical protein
LNYFEFEYYEKKEADFCPPLLIVFVKPIEISSGGDEEGQELQELQEEQQTALV